MIKININPLSVNECWQGRRFKTRAYKLYEKELLIKLKNYKTRLFIPFISGEKIELYIQVGFSNKGADLDNIIKPLQDILQKKFHFNDNQIYRIIAEKHIVKKGDEFINFSLSKVEEWEQ